MTDTPNIDDYVPCQACGWSKPRTPDRDEEPPIVSGALDAQERFEKRHRLHVYPTAPMRPADTPEPVWEPTGVVALVMEMPDFESRAELTPDEARELASKLIATAAEASR